jgi:hypothetical protein
LFGSGGIVQKLLNIGADVNAKSNDGDTALMIAAQRGKTDTVQALLDKGAEVNATNIDGETALMVAAQEGHTAVVELLKQAEAKGLKIANNEKMSNHEFAEVLYKWVSSHSTEKEIKKSAKKLGIKIRNDQDLRKISGELLTLNMWLTVDTCKLVIQNKDKANECLNLFHRLVYEKHLGGTEKGLRDWIKSMIKDYTKYDRAIKTDHPMTPLWVVAELFSMNFFGEIKKDPFLLTRIGHYIALFNELLEKLIMEYDIE